MGDGQERWDEFVGIEVGDIMATVNRSTRFTPNRMMLCREVLMPRDRVYVKAAQKRPIIRAAGEQHAAVKLDKESVAEMEDVVEMRELMVRTRNDSCTLVIDRTINNHCVEAVVDSGAQVSVLSRRFYDSPELQT